MSKLRAGRSKVVANPKGRGFYLGSVLALGLVGCTTVGPNFKPPGDPQGASASSYGMVGEAVPMGVRLDPNLRASGPWWLAFGSRELDTTVRLALAESPSLAEARATLARFQDAALAEQAALGPSIDGNAGAQRQRFNSQSFGFSGFPNHDFNTFSVGVTARYDLDLFGGGKRRLEESQALTQRAARQADAAYLSLSGNVAVCAMRIAGLRAQISAVHEVLQHDRRIIEMLGEAIRLGGRAPSALTQAQAQLATDQALLPPLERELDAARHQLALLVGKPPAEWSAPDFDLAGLAAPAEIPISLPSQLVRRRPDILAAESDLHAATAAVGVATANQYPDMRLSAGLTQATLHPEDIFGYNSTGWTLVSGLTGPLFDGGVRKARRAEAEATARVSLARYQQTVLSAFVQVSDLLAALNRDQESRAALSDSLLAGQARSRQAEAAWKLGGGSQLKVVEAHRELARAHRALAEAEGQRLADMVELYTATAADWRGA